MVEISTVESTPEYVTALASRLVTAAETCSSLPKIRSPGVPPTTILEVQFSGGLLAEFESALTSVDRPRGHRPVPP